MIHSIKQTNLFQNQLLFLMKFLAPIIFVVYAFSSSAHFCRIYSPVENDLERAFFCFFQSPVTSKNFFVSYCYITFPILFKQLLKIFFIIFEIAYSLFFGIFNHLTYSLLISHTVSLSKNTYSISISSYFI